MIEPFTDDVANGRSDTETFRRFALAREQSHRLADEEGVTFSSFVQSRGKLRSGDRRRRLCEQLGHVMLAEAVEPQPFG